MRQVPNSRALVSLIEKACDSLRFDKEIIRLVCDNVLPQSSNIFAKNERLCVTEDIEYDPKESNFYGLVLKFGHHSKSLVPKEEKDFDIITIPGLGGAANQKRGLSTYQDFVTNLFPDQKCAFYSPIGEREGRRDVRYARGMLYYANQHSINEVESANFYKQVLEPRLIDNGKIVPPEHFPKLIMASFSIGCREAESHLRYFEKQLECLGVSDEDCKKYTDRLARVNVASPRDWSYNVEQPHTLSFISQSDFGSKKPMQFMRDFYLNKALDTSNVSLIKRHASGGDSRESLVILPDGFVACGSVRNGKFYANPLGHNLTEHTEAIKGNKFTSEALKDFLLFLDPKMTIEEFGKMRSSFTKGKKHKELVTDPTLEDIEFCLKVAENYQRRESQAKEAAEKAIANVVPSPSECGNVSRDNRETFPDSKDDLGSAIRPVGRSL